MRSRTAVAASIVGIFLSLPAVGRQALASADAGGQSPAAGLHRSATKPENVAASNTWFYTIRDENNRPAIEYHLGQAGNVITDRIYAYLGNTLVATYEASGNSPGWVYYGTDHLGSVRTVMSGSTCTQQFQPFGESAGPACSTGGPVKFAGMERDSTSGNDYDHARFHGGGSALGRFLSPDQGSGHSDDPQTWNRYAYVANNPLRFVDDDGLALKPADPARLAHNAAVRDDVAQFLNRTGNGILVGPVDTALSLFLPESQKEIAANLESSAVALAAPIIPPEASELPLVLQNAQKGAAFEQRVGQTLEPGQTGVVSQVTLKTGSGVKTRVDFAGRQAGSGEVSLTEAKSSATAALTRNQKAAYPEIAKTGATVVGNGKPGFQGGLQIPPTEVKIVRPK